MIRVAAIHAYRQSCRYGEQTKCRSGYMTFRKIHRLIADPALQNVVPEIEQGGEALAVGKVEINPLVFKRGEPTNWNLCNRT